MQLIITARPGLILADFNFGLYLNNFAQSTAGLSVTEIPLSAIASNYVVGGLSEPAAGEFWSLTWDDGTQRQVRRYPESAVVPSGIILPIRIAGVILSDLGARLLLGSVEVATDDLVLTDLGDPHDYLLTGLATPPVGSAYTLVFTLGGVVYHQSWPTLVAGVNAAIPDECYFITQFRDLMPFTLIAQPGYLNAYGTFIASGAAISAPCYIEGEAQLVRGEDGHEILSTMQAYLGGFYHLTTHTYRFTVPSIFSPSADLQAIAIEKISSQSGPCYEVVHFPWDNRATRRPRIG